MNNQELMLTRIRQNYLQLKFVNAVETKENNCFSEENKYISSKMPSLFEFKHFKKLPEVRFNMILKKCLIIIQNYVE
jgi:hypothetical protein